jgi:TctA family transporter
MVERLGAALGLWASPSVWWVMILASVYITLGCPRFTFGSVQLVNGVNFIPAMIGLFGISKVIRNVAAARVPLEIMRVNHRQIFRGVWEAASRYRTNILRSGAIGTFSSSSRCSTRRT